MKRPQEDKAAPERQPTQKLQRSTEPPQQNRRSAAALGAPVGAAAMVAGRHLDAAPAVNTLHHQPTDGLVGESTNALAHHVTEGVGAEAVAAVTGAGVAVLTGVSASGAAGVGTAAGLAGGTAVTGSAVGVATGAGAAASGAGGAIAAGGSSVAAGAGQSTQAIAIGAFATAAVATVVVVVATTGDEPPVVEAPATTTTTVASASGAERPSQGSDTFETTATGLLSGNLLADVDQDTQAGPLMIVGLLGEPTNVGVPVTLETGAILTVDPLGSFQYSPAPSFSELSAGETIVEEFIFVVTNVDGFVEEWTARISVVGENRPPSLDEVSDISVVAGASVSREVTANDPDGDPLRFEIAEGAPPFVSLVDAENGPPQLVINPGEGDAGSYQLTLLVSDGAQPAFSASRTVSVTVTEPQIELERVNRDLIALYDFKEGSGGTISSDLAGGPALVVEQAAVVWQDGTLTVNEPTAIRSTESASGLIAAIKTSNEFSVEAWVTPANTTQAGPARVVSISEGTGSRNVSLAQGGEIGSGIAGDRWTSRQRSTGTSTNGLPTLATSEGAVTEGRLTHLVLTRDSAGEVRIYVDGAVSATGMADGDLSTWDDAHPFVLANETTMDRPWLGSFHLVAVYARALSEAEVDQNLMVGVR